MFGNNAVAKVNQDPAGSLVIKDVMYTIQGEGPDAGRCSVFVRLAGCNLRCYFCDTDFEGGTKLSVEEYTLRIGHILDANPRCDLVVITGGEPLLQNIIPLVHWLNHERACAVAIETAGTVWLDGLDNYFSSGREWGPAGGNILVCSPKTPKIHPGIVDCCGAWKYIVKVGETDFDNGLPWMSTQTVGVKMSVYVPDSEHVGLMYLQAQDEQSPSHNQANVEHAAALCMKHGYRLSVQTHKIAGVP